jgi:16S rRNA (guanine1207-N2)-methyltransferase
VATKEMNKKARDVDHYFSENPKSHTKLGLVQTCFRGRPFEFLTSSGIFSKNRIDLGTRLLIECMSLPETGRILDIGCGYGPVGIAAATFRPDLHVVMTDVNRRAVWLAEENIERNRLENVEVRRGNLYEPVEDRVFNCVLSNPPISAGMETVKAIIYEAPKHISKKGVLQMVAKSKVAGKRFRGFFEESFGNIDVLARESGYRVLISQKE